MFWYAAGPDALAELQKAIGQAQEVPDAADPTFFTLVARPGGAVELLDGFTLSGDAATTFGPYRPAIERALGSCTGRIKAELTKRPDGTVQGTAAAPRCLLEAVGRVIAEYSRRNRLAG